METAFFEKKVGLLFVTVDDSSSHPRSFWIIDSRDVEFDKDGNFKVVTE